MCASCGRYVKVVCTFWSAATRAGSIHSKGGRLGSHGGRDLPSLHKSEASHDKKSRSGIRNYRGSKKDGAGASQDDMSDGVPV